jgi:hypothetical protein
VDALYERCTGKPAGVSSGAATAGPHYRTPFEDLLEATLTEAGETYTGDALRSLIRSVLRGKPKK